MLALAVAALGAGEVEPDAVDILEITSDSEEIRSAKKIFFGCCYSAKSSFMCKIAIFLGL